MTMLAQWNLASNLLLGLNSTSVTSTLLSWPIHGATLENVGGMTNVIMKTNCVSAFTNRTNVALEQLKEGAKKEGFPFRWSGRYIHLVSVLHLKKPLKNFFKKSNNDCNPVPFIILMVKVKIKMKRIWYISKMLMTAKDEDDTNAED